MLGTNPAPFHHTSRSAPVPEVVVCDTNIKPLPGLKVVVGSMPWTGVSEDTIGIGDGVIEIGNVRASSVTIAVELGETGVGSVGEASRIIVVGIGGRVVAMGGVGDGNKNPTNIGLVRRIAIHPPTAVIKAAMPASMPGRVSQNDFGAFFSESLCSSRLFIKPIPLYARANEKDNINKRCRDNRN
jgi:hypothetical protein